MNRQECLSVRDGFCKSIYDHLFNWLVKRMNYNINDNEFNYESVINDKNRYSISILDIFGFEVFKTNSLEQFCINYANEKLQQLYISYIFKAEINEFIWEGLKDFLCELNFRDNQSILDLFDALPTGIFPLLDESSSVSSTDEAFLNNIIKFHKTNDNFKLPKIVRGNFIIIHSAKDVEYSVLGFRFLLLI